MPIRPRPRPLPLSRRLRRAPRPTASLAAVAVVAGLSSCTPIVATEPADDANNPRCADVIVRMPDELGGLAKRETNAQGTAAWGEPERILLTCGVAVPAASELPCVEVEGVYWLRDGTRDPLFVFTSYGREPAIDVAIENTDDIAPGVVLSDLSTAVGFTEPNGRECTDIEDSLG